jgi:3-deoxy-7-phosphoheptulonate synthase
MNGMTQDELGARHPYRLAARRARGGERGTVAVGDRTIGGGRFALIAGGCSVESREQTLAIARTVSDGGGTMLRGGAFKPRTSPYAFQGLGDAGLQILAEAKAQTGLPVVTELMDVRDVEAVLEVADMIQIGARNMQNTALLTEVGRTRCPVMIKRGFASTLEELLLAAEYVLKEGNEAVVLCERGIRTFETAYRFTLDLAAVPALKALSHLPVLVDPSHAAGRRDLVEPLAMAAAAVGADGIVVEIHPDPDSAICDGPQSLRCDDFARFAARVQQVAAAAGAELAEAL